MSCIIGKEENSIRAWTRLSWPDGFLNNARDEKGVFYGSKSTTLESVGILIPLLAFPEMIIGRHLVFFIDNIAVMYGWQNGFLKNDRTATEILKAAQYLGAFLGTTVHVAHVPRTSQLLAVMANKLSGKDHGHDRAQMCPLLKFHKREGNVFLTRFGGNESILLVVPQKLKEDLLLLVRWKENLP